MPRMQPAILIVLTAAGLGGCLRQFAPAPFGTPLDEVCDPRNGTLSGPTETFTLGPATIPVLRGWSTNFTTPQDLELRRIDADLNVWRGAPFIFPSTAPQNAIRCRITRGDTTISIQAERLNGFAYRVDVSWAPLIAGQHFYMQLQTRYVEHLKQMRGIIEGVRFPVDSVSARK